MFELRRLRLLHELALRGTLAAVAEALSYSPSTISAQLAQLERDAGVPLLQPDGRRVRLTPAGEVLAAHAARALALDEAARAELAAAQPGLATVRVAMIQTAAQALLPRALTLLGQRAPGLRVEVAELAPEEGLFELAARTFDLVVAEQYPGHTRAHTPGVDRFALGGDPIRLALPPGDGGSGQPVEASTSAPPSASPASAADDAGAGHRSIPDTPGGEGCASRAAVSAEDDAGAGHRLALPDTPGREERASRAARQDADGGGLGVAGRTSACAGESADAAGEAQNPQRRVVSGRGLGRVGGASDPAHALAALADRQWVLEPEGTAARQWAVQQCRAAGFEPQVRFELADLTAHVRLIAAGHAVGMLPDLVWAGAPATVRLEPLPDDPVRELFVAARASSAGRADLEAVRLALRDAHQALFV